MEALSLSKFEDSRLGNLHVVKGGNMDCDDCNTILNHSDGNSYGDFDDGQGCVQAYIDSTDSIIVWASGGGPSGQC